MKLLEKLRADKRVDEISVEYDYDHVSYFTYLKRGWHYDGAHCFGEDTLTDVRRTLSRVKPCNCEECK